LNAIKAEMQIAAQPQEANSIVTSVANGSGDVGKVRQIGAIPVSNLSGSVTSFSGASS
jgi:hypothetical protein